MSIHVVLVTVLSAYMVICYICLIYFFSHTIVLHNILLASSLAFILFLSASISVSPPKQLEHLTKRRVSIPSTKRLPTKYQSMLDNVKQNGNSESNEPPQTMMTCQSACEMTNSVVLPTSMESSYISLPVSQPVDDHDDEIMV